MEMVTHRDEGLFPKPSEIKMRCSCPDYAGMCKHIAATMYGVGNRLDRSPELLFLLRDVDHLELIEQAIPAAPVGDHAGAPTIDANDLGAIFDIELSDGSPQSQPTSTLKPKLISRRGVKHKKAPGANKKKRAPRPKKG
jgi:uncharacterized Zn finger protein